MKSILIAACIVLLAYLPAHAQDQAALYIKKAYELSGQGKYAEAIAEIGRAIELRPENASLLIERALFHRSVNDYPSLEADIADALALAPDEEPVVTKAIQIFVMARKCDRALTIADQFIARQPHKDQAYATRSTVHSCLKNAPAAMADIATAIELKPDNSVYRASQARLLSQLGNSDQAFEILRGLIESLEKRIADEPDALRKQMRKRELAFMLSSRAGLFNLAGKYDESIADLTSAIELAPDSPHFHSRAMTHRMAGKYEAAIADFDMLIAAEKSKTFYPYSQRGDLHMMAGNYEKAVADYEQAMKLGTPANRSTIEPKLAAAKQKLGQNPQH